MPPTLGQRLQRARESKGLSLQDVAHRTRISLARLQDLENDHYASCGSTAYAKSFLQTYAKLVEVDPHDVTDHMNPATAVSLRASGFLPESQGIWLPLHPDRSLTPPARPVRVPRASGAFAAVIAALLLIGSVLWAAAYWNERTAPQPPESRRAIPANHGAGATEEIRPAMPQRGDNVPIRRALPVEDDAKAGAGRR